MWAMWVLLGIIGVLVFAAGGAFLILFASALLERHIIQELAPLAADQAPSSATAHKIADEAVQAGLLFVGLFGNPKSTLLKSKASVYLSEDGVIMMMLPSQTVALGYRLISRMADDVWLVSGEVPGGGSELSRYRIHEHVTGCSLAQVLAFHRDRVAAYDDVAVPFNPDTLVQDLCMHDRKRAEDVVARGFARWVDAAQTTWRFTLRGACRICTRVIEHHTRLNQEAADRAARYKQLSEY